MSHSPPRSSHFSNSRNARKGASGVRRRSSGLAPAGVVFRNNTSYHFPAAAGRRPSESRDGRPPISMARGGGSRPRAAPRIPSRAPRATKADTWRAFPPKTSGPTTRPRRGLPRAAQAAGTGYFFVTSQVRPIQPARPAHKTHARSKPSRPRLNPARFANGRWPSRYEAQGCAADGTTDSPELWRAAASAIMCE